MVWPGSMQQEGWLKKDDKIILAQFPLKYNLETEKEKNPHLENAEGALLEKEGFPRRG